MATTSKLRLPIVHRAQTREELDAIYRFRYDVYSREFGRLLGGPDHKKRQVRDADDELPTTTLLYTGTPERITSTVRLRHWRPGAVPAYDVQELSLDLVPDLESRSVAEIGRLMVCPKVRGRLLPAALIKASYACLVGEHAAELVFCYCSPGLTHFYRRIAMRPYGGRLVKAPDGLMIPLMSVTSDAGYYRRSGSFLASLVDDYFGPRKRPPTDLRPFRELFADHTVLVEREAVLAAAAEHLERPGRPSRCDFLGRLNPEERREVIGRGMVVEVEAETLVTRRGFKEDELYVVLEGRFTYAEDAGTDALEAGSFFGQDGLLENDGRRRRSVRAESSGKLLILRGVCLRKILRRRPELRAVLEAGPDVRPPFPLGAGTDVPSGTLVACFS